MFENRLNKFRKYFDIEFIELFESIFKNLYFR